MKTAEEKRDPLLKPADVAKLLNVSRSTVTGWIRRGLIVTVWLPNGLPRIRRSEVQLPFDEC